MHWYWMTTVISFFLDAKWLQTRDFMHKPRETKEYSFSKFESEVMI